MERLAFAFTVVWLTGNISLAIPLGPAENWNWNTHTTDVDVLVKWVISQHTIIMPSHTVRFLTPELSNETVDHWLSYFGQSQPFVTGNVTSLQTGKPVIVLFLLCGNASSHHSGLPNYTLHWINSFSSRQRDHFVFIGEKFMIAQLWQINRINQLGQRWGWAIDTKEFMGRIEGNPLEPGVVSVVNRLQATHYGIGSNIRGRHLKINGWAHVPPYHFILDINEQGIANYDGSHARIFKESALMFNFTWELYSDENSGSYGQLLENGTWTGMVGAVHNGHYDACLYLGAQFIWYPMFDFSGSLSGAAIRFLTARPKSELQWQAFLYPFRVPLWISIISSFILVIVCILGLRKVMRSGISNDTTETSAYSSIVNATTLSYLIVMEQTAVIPKGVRILCGAWLLFSIIVGTAYKSQVMSALTFPFTEQPPSTYQELASRKQYKSILNNIGGLEVAYFQSNDSQLVNKIAKTMRYEPFPIKCIGKAVLIPKTVCIGWVPFLEFTAAEWASPDLQVTPTYISVDKVMEVTLSVAFQKYSPLTLGFTPIITTFWESGIYTVWENDVLRIHKEKGVSHYKENPNNAVQTMLKSIIDDITGGNEEKPLKISHLKMMFVVLAIGVCLGTSTFIFEKIFNFVSQRKRNGPLINNPFSSTKVQTIVLP